MSKIKFIFKGSGDGISYYKCNICKDVFNEDEISKHLTIKCKKPLINKQIILILKKSLNKAINNGYRLNF